MASENGHDEIVQMLLESGANPDEVRVVYIQSCVQRMAAVNLYKQDVALHNVTFEQEVYHSELYC